MRNSPLIAAPSSVGYIQAVEDRLWKGRLCGDLCSLGKVEEDCVHAQTLSKAEACTGEDEGCSKGSPSHPAPKSIQGT